MSKLSKFTFRLAAASVIAMVPASPSLADPDLPNVGLHQHCLQTPSGNRVAVGPDVFANPDLRDAWNQFHFNVHASATRVNGVVTPIETLGPQEGAEGLSNGQGAELKVGGC